MAINPSERPPMEGGVIQPATTEQILGRSADAADTDPVRLMGGADIDPKWKKHYESLLQIRDGIIDEETRLERQSRENQPEFIKDTAAEAASASFTRDLALSRVSGYQTMLDEVNEALGRIQTGSYGICEMTGKPIPEDRLEAVPWTRFTKEAELQLERAGTPPIHFELGRQLTTGDAFAGETEVESNRDGEKSTDRA
jgi:RNA polymerase-binding transcription factor DksA